MQLSGFLLPKATKKKKKKNNTKQNKNIYPHLNNQNHSIIQNSKTDKSLKMVLPLPASVGLAHLIPPSFKNSLIKGSFFCKWSNRNETWESISPK